MLVTTNSSLCDHIDNIVTVLNVELDADQKARLAFCLRGTEDSYRRWSGARESKLTPTNIVKHLEWIERHPETVQRSIGVKPSYLPIEIRLRLEPINASPRRCLP